MTKKITQGKMKQYTFEAYTPTDERQEAAINSPELRKILHKKFQKYLEMYSRPIEEANGELGVWLDDNTFIKKSTVDNAVGNLDKENNND